MATHDYGGTLASSTTDSGYTTIARIIDIDLGEDVMTTFRANILANTTHKKGAGCIELGDIVIQIEFNKTDYNTIFGYFTARTARWWKVTDVDGNIWKGQALLSKFKKVSMGKDDRQVYQITLTPDNADWTFTAI